MLTFFMILLPDYFYNECPRCENKKLFAHKFTFTGPDFTYSHIITLCYFIGCGYENREQFGDVDKFNHYLENLSS